MQLPMKLIAFFGEQQAGKSESAKAVATKPGWVKVSFADSLYQMMSAMLGSDARLLPKEEPIDGLCGKTLRECLQSLGTEWGRGKVGESVWLDAIAKRIVHHGEVGAVGVVIDDLRFSNEYNFLKACGAQFIRVDRASQGGSINSHASEVDWVDFTADAVILNNGSVEELRGKAQKLTSV